MKKIIGFLILISIFGYTFAHPGNTDENGCHYCETNCEFRGYKYGEYHCHKSGLTCDSKDISTITSIDEENLNTYTKNILIYYKDLTKGIILNLEDQLASRDVDKFIENSNESHKQSLSKYGLGRNGNLFDSIEGQMLLQDYNTLNQKIELSISSCNVLVQTIEEKLSSDKSASSAIMRLYTNGLTKFSTEDDFMPNSYITREQASKFFSIFGEKTLELKLGFDDLGECNFKDIVNADETLKVYMNKACKLGVMKGNNQKFAPFDNLTKAQAITVLMRMIYGKLDESGDQRYEQYFNKAASLGILKDGSYNYTKLDGEKITRGEMGILIYNTYLGIQ